MNIAEHVKTDSLTTYQFHPLIAAACLTDKQRNLGNTMGLLPRAVDAMDPAVFSEVMTERQEVLTHVRETKGLEFRNWVWPTGKMRAYIRDLHPGDNTLTDERFDKVRSIVAGASCTAWNSA